MLRVDLFVLLGFAVGVPVGAILTVLLRRFLAARDEAVARRVQQLRVEEVVAVTLTEDLLEELSKRDLGRKR